MKIAKLLLSFGLALVLLVPPLQSALTKPVEGIQAIPTFNIVGVVEDQRVTVETRNFPANRTFVVRMGPIGTRAVNGTRVGEFNSGRGGTFQKTFDIPSGLRGSNQIAIRMDATSGGYFAYNWFSNDTSGTSPTNTPGGPTNTPGPTRTPRPTNPPAYSGIPTFSIQSVTRDQTVTVRTRNFPPGKRWTVRMGAFGTRGVNGTRVETFSSDSGGAFDRTFDIPSGLRGSAQIAIRMEADTGGWFAFNWFYNSNSGSSPTRTPGGPTNTPGPTRTPRPTSPPGYSGIPTFSIVSVVRDDTVTIRTRNFPPDMEFVVRMGPMGTRGVNGTRVETIDSGDGGAFEDTYDIPAGLRGSRQISIRLESSSGYFAYNWFYNSTSP
jgi:hypothetical protein